MQKGVIVSHRKHCSCTETKLRLLNAFRDYHKSLTLCSNTPLAQNYAVDLVSIFLIRGLDLCKHGLQYQLCVITCKQNT